MSRQKPQTRAWLSGFNRICPNRLLPFYQSTTLTSPRKNKADIAQSHTQQRLYPRVHLRQHNPNCQKKPLLCTARVYFAVVFSLSTLNLPQHLIKRVEYVLLKDQEYSSLSVASDTNWVIPENARLELFYPLPAIYVPTCILQKCSVEQLRRALTLPITWRKSCLISWKLSFSCAERYETASCTNTMEHFTLVPALLTLST